MTREQLLREIGELDGEINRILGSTELPKLESRPFPLGTWILALIGFGWYYFGEELPVSSHFYEETATYVFYGAVILAVLAALSTLSWLFRRRGGAPAQYRVATEKVKVLQERRRELQLELKQLDE